MTAAAGAFPRGEPRFDGAAVVITGVGRPGQSGEVVARAFAEHGAVVECIDRGARVHDRVSELLAAGFEAAGTEVDLTDAAATSRVAAHIADRHKGRVAAVVALAGGFGASGPLAESDPAVLARQVGINLTSAYLTARAFLPPVRAARGAFVFVTSASILGGRVAGIAAYAMAKSGVVQLVRAIAQEETEHGVRANALAPTSIRTAANVSAMGENPAYVTREEFAAAALALCSPALSRVNGQVFQLG